MPFSLHPDIDAGIASLIAAEAEPSPPPAGDVATRRERVLPLWKGLMENILHIDDVETKDLFVKAFDGHEILLRWYWKRTSSPGSAVLYIHGGGMIYLSVEQYHKLLKRYVSASGVPFLAVEYRLAPEARAPTLVTDAYAGLEYLHAQAAQLGIDPLRIGIMGDSAGGGIAASLAYYAKQNGGPAIKKQILVYPMLDDRNLAVDLETAPFAMWTTDDNKTGWGALLNGKEGSDSVGPIDAPARMTVAEAQGLPPTYMDVGQLDIFADENLQFAQKLGKAGVDCEFHLIPAVPHVFDSIAPTSTVAQAALGWRVQAIQSL